MTEKIEIKLLPFNDWKNLRIIKCDGNEYNRYVAFIAYLRTPGYEQIDELDNEILKSLDNGQHQASFYMNAKLYKEGQLEEILETISSEFKIATTIQMNPIITDEMFEQIKLGKKIFAYVKTFNVNLMKGSNYLHFNNYYITNLENVLNETLQSTITPL